MPAILSVGTALPDYVLRQDAVREFAHNLYSEAHGDIDRLVRVFDNADIESRHFCVPLDWFAHERTFKEKNDLYITNAIELSRRSIEQALECCGMSYQDIDTIIFASTTGIATPSIDARLIEQLPFRRNIRRLPVWGLGCAAGAASLSRAMELARARPEQRILVVVVELCGLTFMRNDLSKAAFIAASLFGEGGASVIVTGDESGVALRRESPRLLDASTQTLPDSLGVMGWEIGEGFKIVISRDIPSIVRTFMRESIVEFLESKSIATDQIDHYVAHPGGAKVLQAYSESLSLADNALRHTRQVLRTCGNMSAASVLFVLDATMREIAERENETQRTELGVLCALGPGFSSEVVLMQWG